MRRSVLGKVTEVHRHHSSGLRTASENVSGCLAPLTRCQIGLIGKYGRNLHAVQKHDFAQLPVYYYDGYI